MTGSRSEAAVLTGLDRVRPEDLPGRSFGLLTNYAAVDRCYRGSQDVLRSLPGKRLAALFGPQHGLLGETQDNMIEWEGYLHPTLGVPVHSLYGRRRRPEPGQLEGLDCLVVDIQDVGSRYYTYVYTMALCMRACAEAGVPVVVLDRPNPLGGEIVEGRLLRPGWESFVGMYPLPTRHALTVGEAALLFARLDALPEPSVVRASGWERGWPPRGLPWVLPSPNMPTPEVALVYPGMCLLEGTNLSEGRGTTRPFTVFGAPWLSGERIAAELNGTSWMEGAILRPHGFVPTFGKHRGEVCSGCEIHVTERSSFRALRSALGILLVCFGERATRFRPPPYEYEYRRMPMDILAGGDDVRRALESSDAGELKRLAAGDVEGLLAMAGDLLLYPGEMTS